MGKTERLFESDRLLGNFSVAKDGRFLMLDRVEVEGPEKFSGAMLSSLNKRRGMISGNSTAQGESKVTALVPLAEMFGYSNEIRSATQGKATFTMEFSHYDVVPGNVQKEIIDKAHKEEEEEG